MQERPNVIVLVSDTFRPDHLGISGGGHARTPELDAFVRRGITFDRARSSSFGSASISSSRPSPLPTPA